MACRCKRTYSRNKIVITKVTDQMRPVPARACFLTFAADWGRMTLVLYRRRASDKKGEEKQSAGRAFDKAVRRKPLRDVGYGQAYSDCARGSDGRRRNGGTHSE
jgi:hypothetical protein